jgi:hypothetical protein
MEIEKPMSPDNSTRSRIGPYFFWILVSASLAFFAYFLFNGPSPSITEPPSWSNTALEEVKGRDYSHKEVVLDGRRWIDCNFDGATLYYDGTAPTEMTSCTINNATLTSHSKAIAQTITIMNAFQKAEGSAQPATVATPIPHDRTHRNKAHHR